MTPDELYTTAVCVTLLAVLAVVAVYIILETGKEP